MDSKPPIDRSPQSPPRGGSSVTKRRSLFGRYFKHYRTGVVYDAWEYGHKAWPFSGKG